MKSHTCEFDLRGLLQVAAPPLVPLAAFALLMHLGAELHLLPRPRPTLDIDRTILIHQAESSGRVQDAQVLLLGDSSCLMDVSAKQLGERLGRPVLGLGTLSYLDLNAYAALLRRYAAANPGRLRAVVLLMHPEALRRTGPEAWHEQALERFLAGVDDRPSNGLGGHLDRLLGLQIFRGRLLSRLLPRPLAGTYGRFYGFTTDLERFLTPHRGSAIDPETLALRGNAEYRLAPQLKTASAAFRAAVPAGVKLFVAITPVPETFVSTNYPSVHRRMLSEWGQWLGADGTLADLPATLPDPLFARPTHLNAAGQRAYTELLAQTLRPSSDFAKPH
jgi:hypothetical protein